MLEYVDRYLSRTRGRWSPETTQRYGWFLKELTSWLEENGLPNDPYRITTDHLEEWLDANSTWSASTVHMAISAMRGFFRWAVGLKESPAQEIKAPKREVAPQRVLEPWQIQKILAAQDTRKVLGVRN